MSNVLEYKGYHGTVEYDAEDRILFGHVIGVNDVLAYHGGSVEEIKKYFESCIDGYLETCAELGRQPDKEYKGSFNVRISPELHKQASIEAEKHGISLNQFVQGAIENQLNGENSVHTVYYFSDTIKLNNTVSSAFSSAARRYSETKQPILKRGNQNDSFN